MVFLHRIRQYLDPFRVLDVHSVVEPLLPHRSTSLLPHRDQSQIFGLLVLSLATVDFRSYKLLGFLGSEVKFRLPSFFRLQS